MNAVQRRIWIVAVLASLALGAWLMLRPWPSAPRLVGARPAPPPALPGEWQAGHEAAQQAAAQLATSTLWGPRPAAAAPAASAVAEAPPRWFLQGVVELAGQAPRALLHYENHARPAQTLRAGDVLPDGRVLVSVGRDGFKLRHTPASLRAARKAAAQPASVPLEEWLPLPRRTLAPNG